MLRTIILDDELPAVKILNSFVAKIPFLELKLSSINAFEVIESINSHDIDLLLLDIEMPDINGVDLIKCLDKKPMVIFTTAYKEYALEGYELDIIDYLVKPIRFERFLKAVNKAHQRHVLWHKNKQPAGYLQIKTEYKTKNINYSQIVYIEGLKDYVKIFTEDEMFLTRSNLKGIESKLPSSLFIRVHRSYIVSIDKVSAYQRGQLFLNRTTIPIGTTYQSIVAQFFP